MFFGLFVHHSEISNFFSFALLLRGAFFKTPIHVLLFEMLKATLYR